VDKPETFILTNAQYNATGDDLLGDVSAPADGFESDQEDQRGFLVPQEMPSDTKRAQLEAAADALAKTAAGQLDELLPCDPPPSPAPTNACSSSSPRSPYARSAARRRSTRSPARRAPQVRCRMPPRP